MGGLKNLVRNVQQNRSIIYVYKLHSSSSVSVLSFMYRLYGTARL